MWKTCESVPWSGMRRVFALFWWQLSLSSPGKALATQGRCSGSAKLGGKLGLKTIGMALTSYFVV